jgi:hypothetical protein
LFFSPGDLLPQILDPLMKGVDFLFDFFVHDRVADWCWTIILSINSATNGRAFMVDS